MDLITIYNDMLIPVKVTVDGKEISMSPKSTKMANIRESSQDIRISSVAKNFDGSETKNLIVVTKGFSKVYITPSGIHTNMTAGVGRLMNSDFKTAVIFVEMGSDGRRWPKCMLTPGSFSENILSDGGAWQIVTPERENVVLADIKVPKGARSLNFDGDVISAK